MSDVNWPGDWLRGVLPVCVLQVLRQGPTYGYAISTALQESGLGSVKGGTLYPLLSRFEDQGLVSVEWRPGEGGPGRKYYALTEAGVAAADLQLHEWRRFAGVIGTVLDACAAPLDACAAPLDADAPLLTDLSTQESR